MSEEPAHLELGRRAKHLHYLRWGSASDPGKLYRTGTGGVPMPPPQETLFDDIILIRRTINQWSVTAWGRIVYFEREGLPVEDVCMDLTHEEALIDALDFFRRKMLLEDIAGIE